ncbi:hypothetical protein Q9R19_01305 [Microbacterium sp. ARD32]|uniref:hypothetical protein n=1 Tax=Microbacterium sp. ARD32 TaxID=2962577 RepID=UPI002882386B|nr:hypothetical protein [Microbacterium sp. ARD32]MDT0156253.1 hypothetical protein [Microbacterium sp. ARD32]
MSEQRLSKRSWTASSGVVLIVIVATIVGAIVAAGLTTGVVRQILVPVVVIVGALLAVRLNRTRGVRQNEARVAAVRAAWAPTWNGASFEPEGEPDGQSVGLALPQGWQLWAVRARLRFPVSGTQVSAETWVLESAPGSTRSPAFREVVWAGASTGSARVSIPLGQSIDPLLVKPAWADVDGEGADGTAWMPAVRERVARHHDLVSTLTIGDDRVVFLAVDDPRPEKMVERAQLVRDVAAIVRR